MNQPGNVRQVQRSEPLIIRDVQKNSVFRDTPQSFVTLLLCRAGKIDALASRGLGFAPLVPAICAIAHAFDQDRPVWTELASPFDRFFLRRENVVCFRVPLPPNYILSVRTVLDKNRSERPLSRLGQAELFAELFERRDRSR